MRLLHRNMTIELPDDDPRIAIIEALLFGRTLPAPLPMPEEPAPTEAPAPPVPAVQLRPKDHAFWRELSEVERRELVLLARAPHRPAEMEAALALSQRKLMGCHSRINRFAVRHGVALLVRTRGRGREGKRYWVDDDSALRILTLAMSGDRAEHEAAWERFEKLAAAAREALLARGGRVLDAEGISRELGRGR